jgi:hypothetical protein
MALPVSVVEVVSCRIIVVDGQLHQPQAKHACVKINIRLGISGNCGHVVYA